MPGTVYALGARKLAAGLVCSALASSALALDVPGFGSVSFPTSCAPALQDRFETAVARLHSFEGPEEAFRALARANPRCAMAWWGAAMSVRGNPLAGAPAATTLKAGQAYMAKARAAGGRTAIETGLVDALSVYYRDPAEDHGARTRAYEAAMKRLAAAYPDDPEVQSFYGLAILEAVDLTDTSYARQLEAGRILEAVWAAHPNHPGAPHYLIHAYDYAPLAARALAAARRYPAIASASVHAQHMPSHVFSMLGLWRDSIAANHAAAALGGHASHRSEARLDAADPHGMDFIAYAHLQLAQDRPVAAVLADAGASEERTLVQARYVLERGDWTAAADLPLRAAASPLDQVTVRFARAIGAARAGRPSSAARAEAEALRALRRPVERSEGTYWAGLVDVYAAAADAWAARADHRPDQALALMQDAAARDDAREKHILLENKLLPMRELYAELLLETGHPADALAAFAASLTTSPNRFRSHLGRARAQQALGHAEEARRAYGDVLSLAASADPGRSEIDEARRAAEAPR